MQVVPCAVLALLIHPSTSHHLLNRIFWAFCVYLEAVSVLPQLRVMQNTKARFYNRMEGKMVLLNLLNWTEYFPFHFITFYFPLCFRSLNHLQLIMYLHWVLRGSSAVPTGFFRFDFLWLNYVFLLCVRLVSCWHLSVSEHSCCMCWWLASCFSKACFVRYPGHTIPGRSR